MQNARPAPLPAQEDREKPLSFLEIGVDFLSHGVDRDVALEPLAINEEGRRGIDP